MAEVLYDACSPLQRIRVIDAGERRRELWLGDPPVRQSAVLLDAATVLESPLTRAVVAPLALADKLERILVIGLGAGAIPRCLHALLPALSIDVVELDPLVIAAAIEWCEFRPDATMRVHLGDGREFIERDVPPYDAIIVDVFDPHSRAPSCFATQEFLAAARRSLSGGGLLSCNVWTGKRNPWFDATLATYRSVFAGLALLDVHGRDAQVFVARCDMPLPPRREACARARAFMHELALPFDIVEALASMHVPVPALVPAPILHDVGRRSSTVTHE